MLNHSTQRRIQDFKLGGATGGGGVGVGWWGGGSGGGGINIFQIIIVYIFQIRYISNTIFITILYMLSPLYNIVIKKSYLKWF